MKNSNLNFVLLIVFFVLIGCSSNDGNFSDSQIQINPPNWIQGTWLLEGSLVGDSGWRFTSDDIIIVQSCYEISQRDQLETFSKSGQDVSVNEESTDSTYTLISNLPAGHTIVYSFARITDSKITWKAVTNSIYIKQ